MSFFDFLKNRIRLLWCPILGAICLIFTIGLLVSFIIGPLLYYNFAIHDIKIIFIVCLSIFAIIILFGSLLWLITKICINEYEQFKIDELGYDSLDNIFP